VQEDVGERLIFCLSKDLDLRASAEARAFDQSLEGQVGRMFEKLARIRESMQSDLGDHVLTEADQERLEAYLPTNPTMMTFFLAVPTDGLPP
jgi:hypothetical protein